MNLRKSSLFAAVLAAFILSTAGAQTAQAADAARQYYELRVYSTQSEKQQELINDYWANAAIPAYNRAGVRPIGVFTETEESATNRVFVLIPYDSLDAVAMLPEKLAADSTYQSAAADYMNRTKSNPPYAQFDTSLLIAMTGMPQLALPPSTAEKKPWLFELRTYFSPTEGKGANKIAMFNAGEQDVMKEIGLHPVFFAGTLAGPHMPNLTYMVSGPDLEQHKQHWRAFGSHPVWRKLSGDPQYKDNMTGIQNVFLKRTSASQI